MAVRAGIALCAGVGGLELGLDLVGDEYRTVCWVEREAYAAGVLAARMDDGALAPAPIWSDIATFDGRPWRGRVDIVTAGFPCQPVSVAGKRLGTADDRWLWPHVARVVGDIRPRYVFLENVPGLLVAGFDDILGDLAALGFDAEWGCVSAASVGAPHRRERIFILARGVFHASCEGLEGRRHGLPVDGRRDVANAARHGRNKGRAEPAREQGRAHVAVAGDGNMQSDDLWPPAPDDHDGWQRYLERTPDIEPAVRRGADGLAHRVDRLRATGNGVVPLAAAHAFRVLSTRLHAG